jgi:hypothetical protein
MRQPRKAEGEPEPERYLIEGVLQVIARQQIIGAVFPFGLGKQ